MKVLATPFGSMLARVPVKDREETLAANIIKVNYERMRVLHRPAIALVLRYADLVECILGCMTIQDLFSAVSWCTMWMMAGPTP